MKAVITARKMYFVGGKTNDLLHSSKRIYTLMLQHYKLRRDKIREGIYFNVPVSASPPTTELLNVIEEQPDSWRHSSTGHGADGVAGRRRTSEHTQRRWVRSSLKELNISIICFTPGIKPITIIIFHQSENYMLQVVEAGNKTRC